MDVIGWLAAGVLQPFRLLASPANNFSFISLACGALLVAIVALATRRRGTRIRLRRLGRFLFPRRIWQHRSTALDMRFFLVNAALLVLAYSWMIVSSEFWRDGVVWLMTPLFGAPGPAEGSILVLIVTTLVIALALDLGYWLAHLAMHEIPALWEFHKVHHSAEVMTPLTEWRQHPVEMILFPNVYGATIGIAYGALSFMFGTGAQMLTLFEMNILLLIHLFTIHHLRHAHIWMPIGGFWGRVLHSPAHHHIHHSEDPSHYGKNLGFALSVWDWLSGRLTIPEKDQRVSIGIGEEGHHHHSVIGTTLSGFAKAWRTATGRN